MESILASNGNIWLYLVPLSPSSFCRNCELGLDPEISDTNPSPATRQVLRCLPILQLSLARPKKKSAGAFSVFLKELDLGHCHKPLKWLRHRTFVPIQCAVSHMFVASFFLMLSLWPSGKRLHYCGKSRFSILNG